MKLHYKEIGEGKPIVLLHGVFGSGDNLFTVSKAIAEKGYKLYLLDARNHGKSEQSDEHNYDVMAEDLNDFIETQGLEKPIIMGHSMGGKTVIKYAQLYNNFSKLVIIDIAPRAYSPHHSHILDGLKAIDLSLVSSRKDAELIFSKYVKDFGERQFILKNLYRKDEGGFDWRINMKAIENNIEEISGEVKLTKAVSEPTLFLKGELSEYINEEDELEIKKWFTNSYIVEIKGANHWIHASQPEHFIATISSFLSR